MELPLELSDSETNEKTLKVTGEETEVGGWGYVRQCWHVSGFSYQSARGRRTAAAAAAPPQQQQQVERVATVESTFDLTGELRVVAQLHRSQTHVYSGLALDTKRVWLQWGRGKGRGEVGLEKQPSDSLRSSAASRT